MRDRAGEWTTAIFFHRGLYLVTSQGYIINHLSESPNRRSSARTGSNNLSPCPHAEARSSSEHFSEAGACPLCFLL